MAGADDFHFDREILDAIKFGRIEHVKKTLSDNPHMVMMVDDNETLLHKAAFWDNTKIVRYLIALGSDINFQGFQNRTALMVAIEYERVDTVEQLLELGADIDSIFNEEGRSAIQMVFYHDYCCSEIIRIFIKKLLVESTGTDVLAEKLTSNGCSVHHTLFLRDIELIEQMLRVCGVKDASVSCMPMMSLFLLELEPNAMQLNPNLLQLTNRFIASSYISIHNSIAQTSRASSTFIRGLRQLRAMPIHCFGGPLIYDDRSIVMDNVKRMIAFHVMLQQLGQPIVSTCNAFSATWVDGRMSEIEDYQQVCENILATTMFQAIFRTPRLELKPAPFQRYAVVLERQVTLLYLLNDQHDSRLRVYVPHEQFASTIAEVCSLHQLSSRFPFYYNRLILRIRRIEEILELEDEAIYVLARVSNTSYNAIYIAAKLIFRYFGKRDLERLCQIFE